MAIRKSKSARNQGATSKSTRNDDARAGASAIASSAHATAAGPAADDGGSAADAALTKMRGQP